MSTLKLAHEKHPEPQHLSRAQRLRIRRRRRIARLVLFYTLAPFAWTIDLICKIVVKIFSNRTRAIIAVMAIALAFGLSGFTSSAIGRSDPGTVVAAEPEVVEPSAIAVTVSEMKFEDEEAVLMQETAEDDVVFATTEAVKVNLAVAEVDTTVALAEIQMAKEENARELEEAKAIAQAEAEAQQLHDSIWITSKELANQMGLSTDYDPVLAIIGMRYLVIEEGFTVEGAAGIIGNVYSECRFNVGADNGSHFGIMQWDYWDRWPKISAYLEENGVSLYSRYQDYSGLTKEEQAEIFVWQLKATLHSTDAPNYSKYIEACKVDTSASNSADRWRAHYEVCGGAKSERMNYAEYTAQIYNSLF